MRSAFTAFRIPSRLALLALLAALALAACASPAVVPSAENATAAPAQAAIETAAPPDEPTALPTAAPVAYPELDEEEAAPTQTDAGVPVEAWSGRLQSTPQWPQIDDCFWREEDDTCYGIVFLDPAVRAEAEAYRDTDARLSIWGTLYEGRTDANNVQIEAVRFEALAPDHPQVESEPATEWWGVVVSNPPGAQFDDYLQLMDQNGTRYGIDSLDETIRAELVALRDTGDVIQVWGTLLLNVPDAYGGQIQVERWQYAP